MRKPPSSVFALAIAAAMTYGNVGCLAQSAPPLNEVVLLQPAEVGYPPLARQARITGDVEVQVDVRRDGSVQSASVIKGHDLLQGAALISVKGAKFECRNCNQDVVSSRLIYTFELVDPADPCNTANSPTHTQLLEPNPGPNAAQSRVGVTAEALSTCDPATTVVRVRSLKCLYLWRCGTRDAP